MTGKEQIDTKKKPLGEGDDKKPVKDDKMKYEMGRPLSEQDIKLFKRYGKGPYTD